MGKCGKSGSVEVVSITTEVIQGGVEKCEATIGSEKGRKGRLEDH
jgi:hypothetical protein